MGFILDTFKSKHAGVYAIIIFLLGVCLVGCTTTKKAIQILNAHPETSARYCAVNYPVRDSIIFQKGKVITKHYVDTLQGDSIPCTLAESYVHCPPSTHSIDSIFVHDTITIIRENTAKLKSVTLKKSALLNKIEKLEPWRTRALFTWLIIAVVLVGGLIIKRLI